MPAKKTAKLIHWLTLLAVLLFVFVYTLSFVLSNVAVVSVDFVFFQFESLAVDLLVIASFIMGGVVGLLSAVSLLFLSYRKNKRLLQQYRQHMG